MITPPYCQTMARYNAWQNLSLYTAARGLTPEDRQMDRGAFWGSIQGTLCHLFWGDMLWISRFDGGDGPRPAGLGPETTTAYSWDELLVLRPQLDARIAAWAWSLMDGDLDGICQWHSQALNRDMAKPLALCVMQLFNHQTHHRGQVHAMLTAAGARPEDTDIPFMPDEVAEWP